MKITIDTKEDSHEEIKKIISVLNSLVGNNPEVMSNQNIFETNNEEKQKSEKSNPAPETSASMFSMFGDNSNSNEDHSNNSVSFEPESSSGTEIDSKEDEPVDVDDILSDTEIKIEPREYNPEEDEDNQEKKVNLGISQLEEYDD